MKTLQETSRDFITFLVVLYQYVHKRLSQAATWFESKKDLLVEVLVIKRGTYQRPFLQTSVVMLIGVGIVGGPIIANSYPSVAAGELAEYTPPSAILSSFDDQSAATQKSDKPRDTILTYSVIEGDTLSTIAEKFGISVDTIKWANPNLKSEKLSIGQELLIPPVTGIVVTVKKGDTIQSLAKKYKSDAQKILNWPFNDFTDLDTFALAVGQTLVIPDGVMPEAKPVYSPRIIAQVTPMTGSGQFLWPTQGVLSQTPVSYHMAVDIANPTMPAIMSADAGKVILVEKQRFGYGWHVIVDHENGYSTLYAHMSDIYVSVGQKVSKGSVLGKMGSTGRSSGTHLHFEIMKNGVKLNPLGFYSK